MTEALTVMVTGANRGLGLELVRQYAAEGEKVHAIARAPHSPELTAAANASDGRIVLHALDITDWSGIGALAAALADEPIDILLNNAGIYGEHQNLTDLDPAAFEEVLRINLIAPLMLVEAFLPHIERGRAKRIVTISSRMGSIAETTGHGQFAYRSSKAGVNITMRALANDLAPRGIVVAPLDPGWVRTDMGGSNATLAPAECAEGLRRVIAGLDASRSGRFWAWDGSERPW